MCFLCTDETRGAVIDVSANRQPTDVDIVVCSCLCLLWLSEMSPFKSVFWTFERKGMHDH